MRGIVVRVACCLLLALAASPSRAVAQLRQSRSITAEAAGRVIEGALAEARKNRWSVSIAVVDPAGELIAFLRMDDASPGSVDISRAKARTAARFRRPTRAFEDAVNGGRSVILSLDGVTAVEGGVPVVIDGQVVGAVGVSGVTSAQDAQVAQAGVATLTP